MGPTRSKSPGCVASPARPKIHRALRTANAVTAMRTNGSERSMASSAARCGSIASNRCMARSNKRSRGDSSETVAAIRRSNSASIASTASMGAAG